MGVQDLDILEAVLRLILRQVQRISTHRSLQKNINSSTRRTMGFISAWGTKDSGFRITEFLHRDFSSLSTLNYQFYRASRSTNENLATSTTLEPQKLTNEPPQTPQKQLGMNSQFAGDHVTNDDQEKAGLVVINVMNTLPAIQDDFDTFKRLVDEYKVPEEHFVSIYHLLRTATHLKSAEKCQQLLFVRLLTIAIYGKILLFYQRMFIVYLFF
jgi:hypothetical protein